MASAMVVAVAVGLSETPHADAAPAEVPQDLVFVEKTGSGSGGVQKRLSIQDIFGQPQVEEPDPDKDEQWRFSALDGGFVKIQNAEPDLKGRAKCLIADLAAGIDEDLRVGAAPCDGALKPHLTQKWRIEDLGNNLRSIQAEELTGDGLVTGPRFLTFVDGPSDKPKLEAAPAAGATDAGKIQWNFTPVPEANKRPPAPDAGPAPGPPGGKPFQVGFEKVIKIKNPRSNLCLSNINHEPKAASCDQPNADWAVKHVSYLGGKPDDPMSGDASVPEFQIRSHLPDQGDLCLAQSGVPSVATGALSLKLCSEAGTDGKFKWHADAVFEQQIKGPNPVLPPVFEEKTGIANGEFPGLNLGVVGTNDSDGSGNRNVTLGSGTDAVEPNSAAAAEPFDWEFTDLQQEVLGYARGQAPPETVPGLRVAFEVVHNGGYVLNLNVYTPGHPECDEDILKGSEGSPLVCTITNLSDVTLRFDAVAGEKRNYHLPPGEIDPADPTVCFYVDGTTGDPSFQHKKRDHAAQKCTDETIATFD